MTDPYDQQHHTTPEDDAFLAGARRLRERISGNPAAITFLVIFGALALFLLGTRVGEVVYVVFDGDGMMAVTFGAVFGAVLVVIVAIGTLLDRRQRTRDANAAPLDAVQHERLRAYVKPAAPLVRWYQPAAVAVFLVLAAPGALLLATPWGGMWVFAVLIANPVARWLRAQGHVLTTRDLGFQVPGLSPWPSIAYAALAATAGMAVAVLLWAEALDTTVATTITGGVVIAIIVGGGLVIERHQRRHISRLLVDHER